MNRHGKSNKWAEDVLRAEQRGICRTSGRIRLSWRPVMKTSGWWNQKKHPNTKYRSVQGQPASVVESNRDMKCCTLKTISSVTANVLSNFPVRLLISFWRSLVSDRIWITKQTAHDFAFVLQKHRLRSMRLSTTFVISSFCFLMLLTISKILCVYADRDAS